MDERIASEGAVDGETTVRVLRGASLLEELGPRLDDLLERVGAPIMARRPWLTAWVDCYPDHKPWGIAVEKGDTIDAAALLASRSRHGLIEIVRMGHGATDIARLPAQNSSAARMLIEAIWWELRRIQRPWYLFLGQLSTADAGVREAGRVLPYAQVLPGDPSPLLRFETDRDLRSYVGRNLRKSHRRALNLLADEGLHCRVEHLRDPDQIARILPETSRIRGRRDTTMQRPDKLADPRFARFREKVILELAHRGEVELTLTWIGNSLAAYDLGLLDGDSFRLWDGRIDPQWTRFPPGQISIMAIMRRVFEGGRFREIDFMRGSHPYKLRLATHVLPTENLLAWSSPFARSVTQLSGRAAAALKSARRRLVR